MQYCSCDFSWNAAGYAKAAVIWSFVLSSCLAVQRLALNLGLGGLLPGEEAVERGVERCVF